MEAILGEEIITKGIDGEDLSVKIPEGVKHNEKVVIEGAGYFSLHKEKRGDHII